MLISFCNSNDKAYQGKLNKLLCETFFDFQFWYDLDLWDENYESYSVTDDEEIVSNVCVFKTQILLDEKHHNALSVGAVATKAEYRGRGFSRLLMQHIIEKYKDIPMYLFANESVVDFYPKFGFRRLFETRYLAEYVIDNDIFPGKLRFDDTKICKYARGRVNFSRLDCTNTPNINLFHIYQGYLADFIYDIPQLQTIVIAHQDGGTLKIVGVFSLADISFADLARFLPFKGIQRIEFGFIPYWDDLKCKPVIDKESLLFVRNVNCKLENIKFPELSTT